MTKWSDWSAIQGMSAEAGQFMRRGGRPIRLKFVEIECSHDALAFALSGESGVRDRWGPFVEADYKEAPLIVLGVAHLIAREMRPVRLPAVPPVAFGDDPTPLIRSFVGALDLRGAFIADRTLVSAVEGSDNYFFALCPTDLILEGLDERVGAEVEKIHRAMEEEGEPDV